MKKYYVILVIAIISFACFSMKTKDIRKTDISYPKGLKIIEREDWGWVPIVKDFTEHEIKFITIHHGGELFTKEKNPVAFVRALQSWSRNEKDWIDIPYHFMIDLSGVVYEARPINIPGDTNTEYDPTSHALVEVMGNYEIQELNSEQISTLAKLIALLVKQYDVPLDNIKSHKDYSRNTLCPGKNLYKYLEDGSLISKVEKELNNYNE